MDALFELLFEVFFEIILELVLESGFRGVAELLANRIVRVVLGVALAVVGGFGAGYWWGARLTERGRTEVPNSLWVSIGLAIVFAVLALSSRLTQDDRLEPAHEPLREKLAIWRWAPTRLLGFALMNAATAAGIAAGFTPMAPH